jgi:hypothetical protein
MVMVVASEYADHNVVGHAGAVEQDEDKEEQPNTAAAAALMVVLENADDDVLEAGIDVPVAKAAAATPPAVRGAALAVVETGGLGNEAGVAADHSTPRHADADDYADGGNCDQGRCAAGSC